MPRTYILEERMVGTASDDVFCCLLFDRQNKTLRVIDFKTKNFSAKQEYLKRVLMTEGMQKVFTIVERGEVGGWRKIDYRQEGSIPAFYNRSDAYIMSCCYDGDHESKHDEDSSELEGILLKIKTLAEKMGKQKRTNTQTKQIYEVEAIQAIHRELKRRKDRTEKGASLASISKLSTGSPIFSQFSREIEHLYFTTENRKTKQVNLLGAECQEYYRNAKIDVFFPPVTKADMNLARSGLAATLDILCEMKVVGVFSLAPENASMLNALYLSCGFNNTGRLIGHRLQDSGPQNLLLWSKRLDRPPKTHG
ncbi:MAG: hypothetical protein GY847_19590 [Proteobacteria bacterium]|nr:hypothetical protein [Pseudomonadota bacterium]